MGTVRARLGHPVCLTATLLVAAATAGCGRLGFREHREAGTLDVGTPDAAMPDSAMDAPTDAPTDAVEPDAPDGEVRDAIVDDAGFDAGPLPDDVVYGWARTFGGSGLDSGFAVAVGPGGRVFVAGVFQNYFDLGVPMPATSAGGQDIFLAAFTPDGTPIWLRSFGSSGEDQAVGLTAYPTGGVVLAGNFSGSVDFGGPFPLVSAGFYDAVVARFEAEGPTVWARRIGGAGLDGAFATAIDPDGDVVLVGAFEQSVVVGTSTLNSVGSRDTFLVRYNSMGDVRWARSYGGGGADIMLGMTLGAGGDIFVAGTFAGTANFGMGPLTADGPADVILARYDPTGMARWTRRYGGPGDDQATRIAATPTGIVVGGTFESSVNFGTGSLISAGMKDAFVAGYDADATPRWSVRFGDAADDSVNSVAVDRAGNAYATGRFEGIVDFGDGRAVSGFGGWDTYIASYSPAGALRWVHTYTDTNTDTANSVTVGDLGEVTVAGAFAGTIDFGGGPRTAMLGDVFVLRLRPAP